MATEGDDVSMGDSSVLPEAPGSPSETPKSDRDDWDTVMTTYAMNKQSSRKREAECEDTDDVKKIKLSPQSQDGSNDVSGSDDDIDNGDDKTVADGESKETPTSVSKRKRRKNKRKKKKWKKSKLTPQEKHELEQKGKAAKLIEGLSIYLAKHTSPKVDRSILGVYTTKALQSAARHVITKDTLDQLSFCDTSSVERVVFVWLSSVSAEMYLNQPSAFANLSKLPSYPFLIKHPGSETFCEPGRDAFLSVRSDKEDVDLSVLRTKCMLSLDLLKENGYPVRCTCHGEQDSSHSVSTMDAEEGEVESVDHDDYWCLIGDKEGPGVSDTSPLFAVDCEMVSTTHDSMTGDVARVSVVNENGECVYDTYVKPDAQIIDYRTIYSGITAEILENVSTTLVDVQMKLKELIPHDAILVGQSLENDLHSLKLYHPHVIDTALLFTNNNSRHKPKLKLLAQRLLKATIQKYGEGHSSIEDALTCMKLVQLKLQKGSAISFSQSGQSGTINNIGYNIGLFQVLCSSGKSCAFIDRYAGVLDHSQGIVHSIVAETDSEAVRRAQSAVRSNDVLWVELHNVQDYLSQPGTALAHAKVQENFLHQKALQVHSKTSKAVALAATKKGTSKEEIERIQKEGRMQAVECLLESIDIYGEAYKQEAASINQAIKQLDTHVYSLIQACPKGTLVFTICGSGEVDRIPLLYKATKHCPAEELIQSELKRVVKEAREGLVLAHYVMHDCAQ
ncbi:uncharacterized protein [Dysidea avara]|uniref:uncharacterized protein n=1 Tax=Dysidea avara TaxID=196820 RepID=UPI00332C3D74